MSQGARKRTGDLHGVHGHVFHGWRNHRLGRPSIPYSSAFLVHRSNRTLHWPCSFQGITVLPTSLCSSATENIAVRLSRLFHSGLCCLFHSFDATLHCTHNVHSSTLAFVVDPLDFVFNCTTKIMVSIWQFGQFDLHVLKRRQCYPAIHMSSVTVCTPDDCCSYFLGSAFSLKAWLTPSSFLCCMGRSDQCPLSL